MNNITEQSTGDTRPCPACKENIKPNAERCRYCQVDINPKTWKAKPKKAGINWLVLGLITALIAVAVIGGVSQLGSNANDTFTKISDEMNK